MISRGVETWKDMFARAQVFSTTPGENGWTIADTSSSGTPTYLCVTEDGGAAKLTLAATSEAENVCLFQNDVLPFDLRQLLRVDFIAQVAGVDSTTVINFGVGSARADDEDTVATSAWFKIEGATSTSALVVETDDGTTDNNDVATGQTLASSYKKCSIDFSRGINDIRFFIDGEQVAASTTFSMAAATAGQNVQLMAQVSKASGTGVPSITIARVEVVYKWAYGA
jgi:hypothetical protein